MDAKKTLEALQKGLQAYEKVVDKEIHYVYYKSGKYYELVFKPHKGNFMHLCGVEYIDPKTKRKYKAIPFYNSLKANKLSPKGIEKKGYAEQKLQVIDQLKDLTTCNLRIIDKTTTYLNLVFSHGIRSRKKIFALALEHASSHYIPTSLLNLRSNPKGNTIDNGHAVHCIYSVDPKGVVILCKAPEFEEYEKTRAYPYKTTPTAPQRII